MSVRSRIKEFEALSRSDANDSGKDRRNEANTDRRKRFLYPGSSRRSQEPEQPSIAGLGPTKSKTSGLSDFEADLQEVWSVRKNIHHSGKPMSTASPNVAVKAGMYSRHGAVPAQQTQGPQIVTTRETLNKGLAKKDEFSFNRRRSPLQEHNTMDTPWNVRTGSFSYSEAAKRPMGSPQVNEVSSPPTAKRKTVLGGVNVVRPTNEPKVSQSRTFPRKEQPERVVYAKKMAQSYLRSVGMGEYAPKRSSYIKEEDTQTQGGKVPRWKRLDSDEFDF